MTIALIHGFLKEKQKIKPEWGSITLEETVLVEVTSSATNSVTLLGALPAAPNAVTATNPKGISFTFDSSVHPDSSAFVLRSSGGVTHVEGCFWEIELTYSNKSFYQLMGGFSSGGGGSGGGDRNPRHRKDQREVLDPIDKPVVFNKSTSVVQKKTYLKGVAGAPIVHTNGLPLTSPYEYEQIHIIYTFSYNIDSSDYDDSVFDPYIGRVNTAVTLGKAIGKLKLVSMSSNEEYESNGSGVNKTEYHYFRVTFSFEYNPNGWDTDAKLVSMSTLQLTTLLVSPFYAYYDKIKISETDYAKEPWPLDANGLAIPYDDNDPADYGYVDHEYPLTADLTYITAPSSAGLKALSIP